MAGMSEEAKQKQLARQKKWRDENREHRAEYRKQWVARNAESVKEYQKEYSAEYRAREDIQFETWVRNLRRLYRMTPQHFNEMWDRQDGKCAICECGLKPRGRDKESACVDHNHETGEVRGLLCRQCNHGIGHMQDSIALMNAAIEYLKKHGSYGK